MRKESPWAIAGSEPSVADDLLSDPIAQTLMRADGVMVKDVVAVIRGLNRRPEPSQFDQPIRPAPA